MSGLLTDHELPFGSLLLLMSSLTAFRPFGVWMILLQQQEPVDGISPKLCLHDNDVDMTRHNSGMDDDFLQGAMNHVRRCREVLKQLYPQDPYRCSRWVGFTLWMACLMTAPTTWGWTHMEPA